MTTPATPAPTGSKVAAWIVAAILLVVGILLFYGIYLVVTSHFYALLTIGILAVVFALVAYLLESISRQPSVQRAAAWGFYGMGFAILLLTIGLNPGTTLSAGWQITGLILVLVLLAASIAGVGWRFRSGASEQSRQAEHSNWQARPPPSAFSYTAGGPTNAPVPAPPPSGGSPPSRPPSEGY
jgi:MFS family permease